uniref:Uncharacterized protein AlNc14C274G10004 n=1 Tax=Albugo laibachii Nc14 TaxID=890382 RepID=F0WUJ3_9STRA|nr:conserved hypothetical protein [Albugo laibachii Nc14]|eukprot:CCA25074.1 conserved hypothetical protein [Albugo laibachii Nc14]
MPFKQKRPESRATLEVHSGDSVNSNAATSFYRIDQTVKYTSASNAAIQTDLTHHALLLLSVSNCFSSGSENSKIHTVIDIGAGSGLSTYSAAKWYHAHGLDAFIIAFDVSQSMLLHASTGESHINGIGKDCGNNNKRLIEQYRGNAAQFLPIRDGATDYVIGISMLQWLNAEGLECCIRSLSRILTSTGCCVFQFYPSSTNQVEIAERIALHVGFQYAEVFVSFPHRTCAKKWYFILSKQGLVNCDNIPLACFFGRRFRRRCAWHIVQNALCLSADGIHYRDRLRTAHVKQVWHIYRKLRRMNTQRVDAEVKSQGRDGKSAFKEKESMRVNEGEEAIARGVMAYFDKCGLDSEAVTYSLMEMHADEVISLCHEVYTKAITE